jgi:hypothetical protein
MYTVVGECAECPARRKRPPAAAAGDPPGAQDANRRSGCRIKSCPRGADPGRELVDEGLVARLLSGAWQLRARARPTGRGGTPPPRQDVRPPLRRGVDVRLCETVRTRASSRVSQSVGKLGRFLQKHARRFNAAFGIGSAGFSEGNRLRAAGPPRCQPSAGEDRLETGLTTCTVYSTFGSKDGPLVGALGAGASHWLAHELDRASLTSHPAQDLVVGHTVRIASWLWAAGIARTGNEAAYASTPVG